MVIGSDQDGSSETPSSTPPNGARAVQSPPSALASSDRKPPLRVSDRISEAVPARPTMPQRASLNEVDQRSLVRIEKGRLALMLSSFSGERCLALYVQLRKPEDGSPGTMTLMMSSRRSRRDV